MGLDREDQSLFICFRETAIYFFKNIARGFFDKILSGLAAFILISISLEKDLQLFRLILHIAFLYSSLALLNATQ